MKSVVTGDPHVGDVIHGLEINIAPTEWPIDVCPDCYAQRDAAVPLITMTGRNVYFRLPTTGERLKAAPERYRVCFHCLWTDGG